MKPRSAQAPKSKKASSTAAKGAGAVPPKLAQAAQEVRIMGGQWKRTVLPVAHLPGLRPTPSRVRETLFNWLGQDLSGWRCLDAFAGTGALGLEAASRGASAVWLVEQSAQLLPNLQRVVTKLNAQDQVQVHRADALALLHAQRGAAWDVIFLDPPFQAPVGAGVVASSTSESPVFAAALHAAAAAIGPQGWVYLEAPRAWSDDQLAPMGLCVHRHLKAGMVHAHLLCLVAHT